MTTYSINRIKTELETNWRDHTIIKTFQDKNEAETYLALLREQANCRNSMLNKYKLNKIDDLPRITADPSFDDFFGELLVEYALKIENNKKTVENLKKVDIEDENNEKTKISNVEKVEEDIDSDIDSDLDDDDIDDIISTITAGIKPVIKKREVIYMVYVTKTVNELYEGDIDESEKNWRVLDQDFKEDLQENLNKYDYSGCVYAIFNHSNDYNNDKTSKRVENMVKKMFNVENITVDWSESGLQEDYIGHFDLSGDDCKKIFQQQGKFSLLCTKHSDYLSMMQMIRKMS